ncbi:hypothetical protein DFH06DRAFT_1349005 [Mycena polygramma]|nr:hypothetical protein DFH06DRAFT_1349005 [Mycena polygramma]
MTNLNNVAPAAPAAGASAAAMEPLAAFSNLGAAVDALTAAVNLLAGCSFGEFASALAIVNEAANNVNATRVDFVASGTAAAAAAPAPVAPTAPAAPVAQPAPPMVAQPVTHIRAHGPWEAGVLFTVVPPLPLSGVPDHGEKWFAITRGTYVGLTKNSAISLSAVTGVSTALSEKFSTQLEALNHFNAALITGAVAVIA